jgi:hypothetical protein
LNFEMDEEVSKIVAHDDTRDTTIIHAVW